MADGSRNKGNEGICRSVYVSHVLSVSNFTDASHGISYEENLLRGKKKQILRLLSADYTL